LAQELGQRVFDAVRHGHIGAHAVDLLAYQALAPGRFAERIAKALAATTAIAGSGLKQRGLMGVVRAIAGANQVKLGGKDLVTPNAVLAAETFLAIDEIAEGHDLIDHIVHPEALDIWVERAACRIVDDARKAAADKRQYDNPDSAGRVGDERELEQELVNRPGSDTAEDQLHLARVVRGMSERDRKICAMRLKGLKAREIGHEMSPAAVRQAVVRLRRHLREK
jgi:hypothetical protein